MSPKRDARKQLEFGSAIFFCLHNRCTHAHTHRSHRTVSSRCAIVMVVRSENTWEEQRGAGECPWVFDGGDGGVVEHTAGMGAQSVACAELAIDWWRANALLQGAHHLAALHSAL